MKKFKEFLCFFIPFLLLSALSVITFIRQCNSVDVIQFMSGSEYLKLMLKDPTFVFSLINSYIPPLIITIIFCAIYKAIAYFLREKITIKRLTNYLLLLLIGFITPVLYILPLTKFFDFTNNLIFCLQISLLAAFIFWLIELIVSKLGRGYKNEK